MNKKILILHMILVLFISCYQEYRMKHAVSRYMAKSPKFLLNCSLDIEKEMENMISILFNEGFLTKLKGIIQKNFQSKRIFLCLVSKEHLLIFQHFLCFLRNQNNFFKKFLFFPLDNEITAYFRSQNLTFCQISKRDMGYGGIIRLKVYLMYLLLMWDYESIISDDDIFYFTDPTNLLNNESDLHLTTNTLTSIALEDNDWYDINVGFSFARPTPATKFFYFVWSKRCLSYAWGNTQAHFTNILEKRLIPKLEFSPIQEFNISRLGKNHILRIKYFHPLVALSAGLYTNRAKNLSKYYQNKNILEKHKPIFIHLAWYLSTEKKLKFIEVTKLKDIYMKKCQLTDDDINNFLLNAYKYQINLTGEYYWFKNHD